MKFLYEQNRYEVIGILHGSRDDCRDNRIDQPSLYTRLEDPEISTFLREALTYHKEASYNAQYGYKSALEKFHRSMTNRNFILDKNGTTVLHVAAKHGQKSIVENFMKNWKNYSIDLSQLKDSNGQTPMHFAASNGHSGTLDHLISALKSEEINVNPPGNNGVTPLHLAVEYPKYRSVKSVKSLITGLQL